MASTISSLGVGSGVLTADVIDQLKSADEAKIITPIDNKITSNQQKQQAYTLLSSLMKSFQNSASALSYDTIFNSKNVTTDGKAQVTVDAGATVESFTLETLTLAKKDITKLGAVASKATEVASADGTLEIKIGSDPLNPTSTLNVSYTAGMTLDDLTQAITDQAGGSVSASILQTGDGAYNLVLSSKNTGADFALTVTDTSGNLNSALFAAYDVATNPTGYEKIQTATDATFKYNGITTTRSTNEISDLILGVTLNLKEEGDLSNVNISQDTSAIVDEMQLFVDSYNTLKTNLNDMTVSNTETGTLGIFNGDNFIKSISREVSRLVTKVSSNQSLMDYGISIDRSGTMSLNKTTLETKLSDDSDAVKLFFTGGTDSTGATKTGIFETINETMKNYTGYNKLLSNFETSLKTDGTNLAKSKLTAQESLDARYEIMTRRFTAYDGMISKTNSMFSSLQLIINAAANGN